MSAFPDFRSFFAALWGYDPFPWQAMLAERVAEGTWPAALDLPTAAGKTACIDAAVYALARQADRPLAKRTAPRRIWFVVDRRIVVDQAHERALAIATKLEAASAGPLAAVRASLLQIGGTGRPLAIARLRGGVLRDDRGWSRIPSQPAVITSTVDQLGSRLLFRGYGSSALTAPIFAGLAANDSLILLDEAHCSVPFLQTLRSVQDYRGARWAETALESPFAFTFLSATPPGDVAGADVFPGAERERALEHPVLQARLEASKLAELVELPKTARGAETDPLVPAAKARALELVRKAGKRRVAVIVNRVRRAEEVVAAIRADAGDAADVVLLTGRLRPFERDRLVERWTPILRASAPDEPLRPVIVVATQCLEVGADFSFDALVSEAASLDALRQRFGRLNRMGTPGAAPAIIFGRAEDVTDDADDPIYGPALAKTWKLLSLKAARTKEGKHERLTIDMGVNALGVTLVDVDDLTDCFAPRPDAPVLLPAHLDLLCQTAPRPAIEPDVQLFLHGKDRGAPDVSVVWRADLRQKDERKQETWREVVALCPPVTGEMLQVPLYRLRAWLAKPDAMDEHGDVEGEGRSPEDGRDRATSGGVRPVLVWRGRDRARVETDPTKIYPDDVIVLPGDYGVVGLGQAEPPEDMRGTVDLWERARIETGLPAALRLRRESLKPWLACAPLEELVALAGKSGSEREDVRDAMAAVLAEQPSELPDWLLALLRETRAGRIEEHPSGGLVLFAPDAKRARAEPDLFADDDDIASVAIADEEVPLEVHTASVVRAATELAGRCLSDPFATALRLAAEWHDAGKVDERFQVLLRQGDELAVARGEPTLAKSRFVPTSPLRRKQIRDASGLPEHFRHEMLSLQLAERAAPLPEAHEDAALVLHLIASHHGHGRPFAPVSIDEMPPAIAGLLNGGAIALGEAERRSAVPPHRIDSGVSERFWRLTRRFGWWGLAYLEAVLRLADWYGSEFNVLESTS